jgi:hypothetical protein
MVQPLGLGSGMLATDREVGSPNLRLELGHQLEPMPVRVTEFAPALPPQSQQATRHPASSTPASGYGPPTAATRLGKQAASLDLTSLSNLMGPSAVRLERHFTLMSGEERADGSLRVVYTASLRSCRPCPLRKPRQWNGSDTSKPRQVSVLLHPLVVGSEPLLWRDGAAECIGAPVCDSFLTSASR